MASGNFRVLVVARLTVIVALMACAVYSIMVPHWIITSGLLLLFIAASTWELITYVEKSTREFTHFLLAIKSADFSRASEKDKRGKTFADFKKAQNIIIEEFRQARIEKEAHLIFLQTAVEQMNTAIICFDADGEIKLFNKAAKKLLRLPYIKNINSLNNINSELHGHIVTIRDFQKAAVDVKMEGELLKLSIRSTEFSLQGKAHRLVSIQNIKTEIENTELEAWEQLLYVLTHEIMNSVTPLSSLSETLKNKANRLLQGKAFVEEEMEDLSGGLGVIAKRCNGLMSFVDHYRTFTTLPVPEFGEVNIRDLVTGVVKLKQDELHAKGITIEQSYSNGNSIINADAGLLEQVLINLLNNAGDAVEHVAHPLLQVVTQLTESGVMIQVYDNGPGIDSGNLEKIFVPFYTTKDKGSGIGLSLSRQIMRMHGGSINAFSQPGERTVFTLLFRQ